MLPPGVAIHLQRSTQESQSTNYRQAMFLHASRLSFFRYSKTGPEKRIRLGITAPLPQDFLIVCEGAGLRQFLTDFDENGGMDIDGRHVTSTGVPSLEGGWLAE